ncbi:MAG: hypothetical protein ACOCZK_01485 [Planctomycetota bacterium]
MSDPLAVLIAIICALFTFGMLVIAGGYIVRRLRLPRDLPEGPRFEPTPPPPQDPGSSRAARERAALSEQRAAACTAARQALHFASSLSAEAHALEQLDDAVLRQAGSDDPAALRRTATGLAEQAAAEAEHAESQMRGADVAAAAETCAASRQRAAGLHAELERHLAPLTVADGRRTRILLLFVLLIALLICLALLKYFEPEL